MATTITKDGNGAPVGGKSRSGASPSDNGGSGTRRAVPNYLRPTISSRGEQPTELKKKPLSSTENRKQQILARRSSFDRPPAASHLQKIISSGLGERSATVRSSSFSGRSGNLQRPTTGPSRTTGKATTKTHLGSGKVVAKKSSSPTASAPSSLATHNEEKSGDAPAVVDDVSGNDNSGVSSVANIEKLASPTKAETEEVPEPAEAEAEAKDMLVEQEDTEVVHEEEEHHDVAHSDSDLQASKEEDDENSSAAAQPQMEEVREDINDKEEVVSDASKGEENEAAGEETEEEDRKENNALVEEAVVAGNEEEKEEEATTVEEDKQGAVVVEAEKTVVKERNEKAKKDPAQANNDIIEETTKKLMESSSRRNKVKALAGAFETVISLEKPGQG